MMLHKLKGAGLPNVYLVGGVTVEGDGEDRATTYSDLDGLYKAIARAIALRQGSMSANELRFLRKRLGLSQGDVAALGGKTEQVVAKWEKGILPVPRAEASLLRLSTLSRFGTKEEISRVVSQLTNASSKRECPYVIKFDGANWKHDDLLAIELATQLANSEAIKELFAAKDSSKYEVKYTSESSSDVSPSAYSQVQLKSGLLLNESYE